MIVGFILSNRIVTQGFSMGASVIIRYANQIVYEGGVKDEQPNGKGVITFEDKTSLDGQFQGGSLKQGKLLDKGWGYVGQFSQGKISGRGKLIDSTNTIYEGHFKEGKLLSGTITQKTQKGETLKHFEGNLEDENKREGILTISSKQNSATPQSITSVKLEGTFLKNKLAGKGKYTFENGDTYEGQFNKGKRHGEGVYKSSVFTLKCEFKDDKIEGQSTLTFSKGDTYEGNTKDGQFNGWGKYTFSDGTVYEGDFYCGSMWGQCKIKYPPGSEIQSYEGEISEGEFAGIGTIFYSNGVIFKGYFQNGMKNGHGTYIYGSGKYKCLYIMNKLIGQIKSIQ